MRMGQKMDNDREEEVGWERHCGYRRYLYHQGNEQTGSALRAAARPWFIPAGKYIPADRPQRSTPLQRGAPLQPVREVAAL